MSEDIKKDRSPNYPKLPLKEAIELAKTLYKKAGKAKIKAETAFAALGYSGPNGAALTTLGTLTSYGLIERDRGVGLSVSPLAIQLIHPTDQHQERFVKAQAALLPKVFLDLRDEGFRDADVEVLRNHLIQKGFTPDGAGVAARVYVENFEFAELAEFRSNSDMVRERNPELKPPFTANDDTEPRTLSGMLPVPKGGVIEHPELKDRTPPLPPGKRVLATYSVPLGSNDATITFTGVSLLPEDFDALAEYIGIFKKQFERKLQNEKADNFFANVFAKPEPKPPQKDVPLPANAMWKTKKGNVAVKLVSVHPAGDGGKYYDMEDGTRIHDSQLLFESPQS